MKQFLSLVVLALVAVAGWGVGQNLSADAVSMALGIILGLVAAIPMTLIGLGTPRQDAPQKPTLTSIQTTALTVRPQPNTYAVIEDLVIPQAARIIFDYTGDDMTVDAEALLECELRAVVTAWPDMHGNHLEVHR